MAIDTTDEYGQLFSLIHEARPSMTRQYPALTARAVKALWDENIGAHLECHSYGVVDGQPVYSDRPYILYDFEGYHPARRQLRELTEKHSLNIVEKDPHVPPATQAD